MLCKRERVSARVRKRAAVREMVTVREDCGVSGG